jgi:hypothetical protein
MFKEANFSTKWKIIGLDKNKKEERKKYDSISCTLREHIYINIVVCRPAARQQPPKKCLLCVGSTQSFIY